MDWINAIITENFTTGYSPNAFIARVDEPMNGLTWTKKAMGGFISASFDIETTEANAWRWINDYIGKGIQFITPLAGADMIAWEGCVYTVTIEVGGATVSRTLANVYNSIEVQYAERIAYNVDGAQKTTSPITDAASIALYGTRKIRASAGSLTNTDAAALAGVMKSQYSNALSSASGSNRRAATRAAGERMVRVSVDCAGWWEYLDKVFHADTNTTSATLDQIIGFIIDSANTANPNLIDAFDFSRITPNGAMRTRYFAPSKNMTAQAAIAEICALGDNVNPFQYCFGLGASRKAYYRPMDFTSQYITRIGDSEGRIYDFASGDEIAPCLLEPGYMIWTADLLPDAVNYANGAQEARNQMIDTVTFIAPNTVSWTPRMAADVVNLQLSRIAGGYWNTEGGWNMYSPDLGE